MTRRSDLLAVYKKEENELFHMKQNLGLDYIQENNSNATEYNQT